MLTTKHLPQLVIFHIAEDLRLKEDGKKFKHFGMHGDLREKKRKQIFKDHVSITHIYWKVIYQVTTTYRGQCRNLHVGVPGCRPPKGDLDSFLSARNRFCNHFPSKHIRREDSMKKPQHTNFYIPEGNISSRYNIPIFIYWREIYQVAIAYQSLYTGGKYIKSL